MCSFGLNIPPVVIIWIITSIILIVGLRSTTWGRNLYALGGSRTRGQAFVCFGARLLGGCLYYKRHGVGADRGPAAVGWSGGGYIGVGDQYLFMTLAAVVVGGTSLLGGWGGYGFTVIGVLVLQVLTSFLVGIGLNFRRSAVCVRIVDPAHGGSVRTLSAHSYTDIKGRD